MGTALAPRPNGNSLAIPGYEREQIDLIKKTVAPDATDTELQLFLHTCKTRGLDPLLKQVYFIKRGGKGTIQVSIDGFRMKAAETRECAGIDDATYGYSGAERLAWATVTVWRLVQGVRCPFTATARWEEYVQSYNGKPSGLWEKMPHTMLAKCAESLALRKAFPAELGGLYTNEEMTQADNPVRQVNTVTGEITERAPVQPRRNSDPHYNDVKHERLDGELIHAPVIDPATNRQAVVKRDEENEHYAPRSTSEEAANAKALKAGIGTHKGWMVAKKLDPENRALSLYFLNRAVTTSLPREDWTSRKELTGDDWTHCNNALAKLQGSELTAWLMDFNALNEPKDSPFSASEIEPCPACGREDLNCLCTLSEVDEARQRMADEAGAEASGTLLTVDPAASGRGFGSD